MFSREILWFLFREERHLNSRPFCGWKKSVDTKKRAETNTIVGPVGSWSPKNDTKAPVTPAAHPSMADQIKIGSILSVISDAVAAGMTNSAETSTMPTTCREVMTAKARRMTKQQAISHPNRYLQPLSLRVKRILGKNSANTWKPM